MACLSAQHGGEVHHVPGHHLQWKGSLCYPRPIWSGVALGRQCDFTGTSWTTLLSTLSPPPLFSGPPPLFWGGWPIPPSPDHPLFRVTHCFGPGFGMDFYVWLQRRVEISVFRRTQTFCHPLFCTGVWGQLYPEHVEERRKVVQPKIPLLLLILQLILSGGNIEIFV